jgi:hypothetical protein
VAKCNAACCLLLRRLVSTFLKKFILLWKTETNVSVRTQEGLWFLRLKAFFKSKGTASWEGLQWDWVALYFVCIGVMITIVGLVLQSSIVNGHLPDASNVHAKVTEVQGKVIRLLIVWFFFFALNSNKFWNQFHCILKQ